jgi:hypothetical protein
VSADLFSAKNPPARTGRLNPAEVAKPRPPSKKSSCRAELGTGLGHYHPHIGPQPVGQCPDNSEAKAAALGRATARDTVESFERPRLVRGWNAGTFVFDLERRQGYSGFDAGAMAPATIAIGRVPLLLNRLESVATDLGLPMRLPR